MSRATSAVDIAPDRGLPVVEQPLACLSYALANAFSCLAPYGKAAEVIVFSTGAALRGEEKHFTFLLNATPRGSKPTTSNRSVTAGLRKSPEK